MTLDDTLSEIEKKWPLELKEAQPASDTKRPMECNTNSTKIGPVEAARLVWPEDAFVSWKREHEAHRDTCSYGNAKTCAFFCGMDYGIEYLKASRPLTAAGPVPEGPRSSTAASVSSPKDSLSPEIVIPALCKAVRELLSYIEDEYVDQALIEVASILEKKDA